MAAPEAPIPAFSRVAIVNRGEPAMRLVRAARELAHELDWPLQTIALYTEPDRGATFVRAASEAHCIGPATVAGPGDARRSAYLDYERLLDALTLTRADAVWVGWGFVAEHAGFAELCRDRGLTYVGPSPEAMRLLGDKIEARRFAERLDVPVAPWSGRPVEDDEAGAHAGRIGYPLLVKASAGGGGRGIRRVDSEVGLAGALRAARAEARAFGDDAVYLEQLIEGGRHVEVQLLGDLHGTVWPVGVRDCSVQRRNQKVVEEAPSPGLTAEQDRRLRELAARLAREAGYENAGTAEFLLDPASGEPCFMEMNTRLQVEHPVTEVTTGLDLARLQLLVAGGMQLPAGPPPTVGHAIEVRINAEDPDEGFAPAPGKILQLRLPGGPGIRVDSGVSVDDTVPAEFDSLLAKLIAFGPTRRHALARLRRALEETAIVLDGGTTNRGFLLELTEDPDMVRGDVHTQWLDRRAPPPRPLADAALAMVAIESYEEMLAVERRRFMTSVMRGRPQVSTEAGFEVELRQGGQIYRVRTRYIGGRRYRLSLDGRGADVEVAWIGPHERTLCWGEQRHQVICSRHGLDCRVEVDGRPHRLSRDEGGVVRAGAPALVVSVERAVGDTVARGECLVVLEAMKMEMPVLCPTAGRVVAVKVSAGIQVDAGAPLVVIEPGREQAAAEGERVQLRARQTDARPQAPDTAPEYRALFRRRCVQALEEMRALVLGLDIDPREARRLIREHRMVRGDMEPDDREILALELDLIGAFSDVVAVATAVEPGGRGHVSLPTARFRALLDRRDDLPAETLQQLSRLLERFGLADLDRHDELEKALHWAARAGARTAESEALVQHLLELYWGRAERLVDVAPLRRVLDELIGSSTHRPRPIHLFAGRLRDRCFEQPLRERARAEHDRCYTAHFRAARAGREPLEPLVTELVDSPHPFLPLVRPWCATNGDEACPIVLEIYLRRFHRQTLRGLRRLEAEGITGVMASYRSARARKIDVLAGRSTLPTLRRDVDALLRAAARQPVGEFLLVDVLLELDQALDEGQLSEAALAELAGLPLDPRLQRLCLSGLPRQERPRHLTLLWDGETLAERELYRGIHHMQAERLELWRLSNFDVERLPSADNVIAFRAAGRDSARDRRLFGFIDARDVSALRDEAGDAREWPALERQVDELLTTLRQAQYSPAHPRCEWNRIYIYPWEPLRLAAPDLDRLARRLAWPTRDLGVEQIVLRGENPVTDEPMMIHVGTDAGVVMRVWTDQPDSRPIRSQSEYTKTVVATRRRGLVYPYEIIRMLTPESDGTSVLFPTGEFTEYDLDDDGALVAVDRPHGQNRANVVVGVISSYTPKHPEGMTRIAILGDPSRGMGALAEPECARVVRAIDLAERLGAPVEWYAVSSGARISMDSGTENLDWTARVLRRIVTFVDGGGEINVVVHGINVGAQAYWNAEATMLMHTRGVLIMTPGAAMVLTGKRALDYSGSVSADNNLGIGGLGGVMGPNGQAQYAARDITDACMILLQHYEYTYVAPGERFPRRATTRDPVDRSVLDSPHPAENGDSDFATVGDVFSAEKNPERKKPFDCRAVLRAVVDSDRPPLERWTDMRDAETAIVMDASIGGIPTCLIGIESRRIPRQGFVPGDGPDAWIGGTLYPLSSKKVARAFHAASGNRPVVVLANLSGFDGSPESMRKLQLEYGAAIGRAVVRFDGPIVFCVICRYHGGAYVVFSHVLNEGLEAAALEGSYASVIGGGPAAAVVFPSEVRARARRDPRVQELQRKLERADDDERPLLYASINKLVRELSVDKQVEVAEEFDRIHNIERAREVGSLQRIVPPAALRPYLVDALERGIRRLDPDYPGAG